MDNAHYYLSRITGILRANPEGMTISEISTGLSMSRNTIGKYIELMSQSGMVDVRSVGKAKIYFLANKVPVNSLFSYLSDAIIQTDERYLIKNANVSAADFLESKQEQLFGRNILDLLTMQGLKQELRSKITSPDRPVVFTADIELIKSERKRLIWLTIAEVVLFNGSGGHVFIIEDVNDWKEAEECKNRYYSLFHALASETEERVFVMNPDLMLTYVNPKYAEIHGDESLNPVGKNRALFCDPHSLPLIKDAVEYVCTKGEPYRTIFSMQERNDLHWFDERLFPIPDNKGEIREVIGVSRDITGFQEGGSASVLLPVLMDMLREAVITTTPSGKVLSWNKGAEIMTGYPRDELIGSFAHSIITPELNADRDLVQETVSGEEISDLRAIIRARGGRKKKVFISTSRISIQGGIVSGVCIVIREH